MEISSIFLKFRTKLSNLETHKKRKMLLYENKFHSWVNNTKQRTMQKWIDTGQLKYTCWKITKQELVYHYRILETDRCDFILKKLHVISMQNHVNYVQK